MLIADGQLPTQTPMSRTFHILNGDALLDFFPAILPGEIIVAREALVDGPINGETLVDFWQTRASFISSEFGEEPELYFSDVVTEFEKIVSIERSSEVNLWFEEDLFCQANLWFCANLLAPVSDSCDIYIVKPPLKNDQPDWGGFGALGINGLATAYQQRQQLSGEEMEMLSQLWIAYKNGDRNRLKHLSNTETTNFTFLPQVIKAQLDRFSADNMSGRPERVLQEIMKEYNTDDFKTIFREFSRREGIYGFGDWQVEKLLKKLSGSTALEQ